MAARRIPKPTREGGHVLLCKVRSTTSFPLACLLPNMKIGRVNSPLHYFRVGINPSSALSPGNVIPNPASFLTSPTEVYLADILASLVITSPSAMTP